MSDLDRVSHFLLYSVTDLDRHRHEKLYICYMLYNKKAPRRAKKGTQRGMVEGRYEKENDKG